MVLVLLLCVNADCFIIQFNEEARSPFVKKYKTIIHPGEVWFQYAVDYAYTHLLVHLYTDHCWYLLLANQWSDFVTSRIVKISK